MADDSATVPTGTNRASTNPGESTRRRTRSLVALAAAVLLGATACVEPPSGGGGGDPLRPVAVADTHGSFGPVPLAVQFLSGGSHDPDGEIVAHEWDFGDGTTSTEANPAKAYTSEGTYEVVLTVTDDDGLNSSAEPIAITAHPPGDTSSLVVSPQLSRSVGLGEDRIAVWTCEVTGSTGTVHDPADVATWAQAKVDAYYGVVSGGLYDPVFTAAGTFEVADNSECLEGARDRTQSPYTNLVVVDTTLDGGSQSGVAGRGGPGVVRSDGTGYAPDEPPSVSRRGLWINGSSYANHPESRTLVHELGHTLHWPHSFIDPSNEYDNPLDVMSDRVGPYACTTPGGASYQCSAQHTLAFNRWATGWVDEDQVVIHQGGSETVQLVAPAETGTQLVAVPATNSSQAVLTVEARPKQGFDGDLLTGGVAVHMFDQRASVCGLPESYTGCPSLWRRQGQAWGSSHSYDHVLAPGESHTVAGVTITVNAATTDGYEVTVSGSAHIPTGALETAEPDTAAVQGLLRRSGGGHRIDLPTPG